MKEWILANALASDEELNKIEVKAKEHVKQSRAKAWEQFLLPIKKQIARSSELINNLAAGNNTHIAEQLYKLSNELAALKEPLRRDVLKIINSALDVVGDSDAAYWLKDYYNDLLEENRKLYNSLLYNEGPKSALKVNEVKAIIPGDAPLVNGFEVLNKYFDDLFSSNPKMIAFGEDLGQIGDVNQGFNGLQEKYGKDNFVDLLCGNAA